jgi:hypothetical protein
VLWTLATVLVVTWALGLATSTTMQGSTLAADVPAIWHLLLVLGVVAVVLRLLLRGRHVA